MFEHTIFSILPGPIPILVSVGALVILTLKLYHFWLNKRPSVNRGISAFVFSQGIAGIAGMVISLCFYDPVPKFSPREFFVFLVLYLTLGAVITVATNLALRRFGGWPDMFSGIREKSTLRSRRQNISLSTFLLVFIYGIFGAFYAWAPDRFVENPKIQTKSKIFIFLFGPWENLLTWAWVASAFIGLLVASLAYLLFFELFWRRKSERN